MATLNEALASGQRPTEELWTRVDAALDTLTEAREQLLFALHQAGDSRPLD
jgi:hypothetical protein